jgi:hypothetical protein
MSNKFIHITFETKQVEYDNYTVLKKEGRKLVTVSVVRESEIKKKPFLTGPPTPSQVHQPVFIQGTKLQRRYRATFNVNTKYYISKTVSRTKVNRADVFSYEFPTVCFTFLLLFNVLCT